jgi:hypothetical protein
MATSIQACYIQFLDLEYVTLSMVHGTSNYLMLFEYLTNLVILSMISWDNSNISGRFMNFIVTYPERKHFGDGYTNHKHHLQWRRSEVIIHVTVISQLLTEF